MKPMLTYVPPRVSAMATRASYAPSGALTSTQVLDYQGALAWLGHLPLAQVTGREPVASAAVLRAFQDNYNREQAARGYRFSPRSLTVDGSWGPATQQALGNYVASARAAGMARVGGAAAPVTAPEADGWHGAQVATMTPLGKPGTTTMVKAGTASTSPAAPVRPSTATPLPPAPPQEGASSFPTGPALAIGAGVLAVAGALYVRSRRRKGR